MSCHTKVLGQDLARSLLCEKSMPRTLLGKEHELGGELTGSPGRSDQGSLSLGRSEPRTSTLGRFPWVRGSSLGYSLLSWELSCLLPFNLLVEVITAELNMHALNVPPLTF